MSIERTQHHPEAQQELRFTARDPVLDEALAALEDEKYRRSEQFPRHLFLYSMKRLTIDTSDEIDGYSRNKSRFEQYRHRLSQSVSDAGLHRFPLAPFMKPFYSGGHAGRIVGIGLRLVPDDSTARYLLSPPFYGQYEQEAGYIPVRYEITHPTHDLEVPLDRLERVLKLGSWAAQATMVPTSPASARRRDTFLHTPIDRTGAYVDEALTREPPLPPVIDFDAARRQHRGTSNGTGPEAA